MTLLVYSDLLPRLIHDEVMRTLESPVGQQSDNLADALHRNIMPDGRNALEVIHKEGFMKKVQSSQVIMTPTASQKIRLDELNNILAEMAKGEDAVKRMAELDSQNGMQTKKKDNSTTNATRNVGEPNRPEPKAAPLQAPIDGVLSDEAIAKQQVSQAARMRADAQSLLKEATRLEADAAKLSPTVVKTTAKPKAPRAPKAVPAPAAPVPAMKSTKATKATTNDTAQKAKKTKV